MRPYTKQKRFCRPSSAKSASANFFAAGALPLACLDRVSVFETLRVYGGRIFFWEKHLERLGESCRALDEAVPAGLKELVQEALKESGHSDALLRISIHWAGEDGRIVLFVTPFRAHPRAWYEKGVGLRTAVLRRPSPKAQDTQIKVSQYTGAVLALLDGQAVSGAHEWVFLGPGGTVAEGAVSNLFIVKGKRLLTPSVASGILKGVTRGLVLDLAEKRGWPVVETELSRHEFYSADECFLTNTSSEVLPVVKLDERTIGGGKPGPWTRLLEQDFKKLR